MLYIQRIHVQSHYFTLVRKEDQARIDVGENSASVGAVYIINSKLKINEC